MFRSRVAMMVAAAGLAVAMAPAAAEAAASQKAVTAQAGRRFEIRRENLWGGGSAWDNGRRFRRGWTNRHQQRLARKARNQARNRRTHRG